jgi:DNA (cytosine-5)-methyltransferase 1
MIFFQHSGSAKNGLHSSNGTGSGAKALKRISHRHALQTLLEKIDHGKYPEPIREEIPAIVSHWLQSPNEPPLLVGKKEASVWAKLLKSEFGSGTAKEIPDIDYAGVPFPTAKKTRFTFIDLFAGIGGFRVALQKMGGKCVFSSDWDKNAKTTYYENYGEVPFGDIRRLSSEKLYSGKVDVVCGGFPCQPFSIAGVSKKLSLGRKHGFQDENQGVLFFEVAKIIKRHRPRAFILENVKHLLRHDKGNTFRSILYVLEKELGYHVHSNVIDAKNFVPQHRERVFIVGFCNPVDFKFPEVRSRKPVLGEILDDQVPSKYTLSDHLWNYLQNYAKKHRESGNGFGFGLFGREDVARTLSARYHKDGSEILIRQNGGLINPRRLTPEECRRLMGFPEGFRIRVSDTQAYRQFGNSVVVPVVEAVAGRVVKEILK